MTPSNKLIGNTKNTIARIDDNTIKMSKGFFNICSLQFVQAKDTVNFTRSLMLNRCLNSKLID